MAVKIHRIRHLETADEIELLNRMLRDLGLAVNGLENASGVVVTPPSGGTNDHHALINLTTFDDHTQYLYLQGRATGQLAKGGIAAGENLSLQSTSHATRGKIILGPGNDTFYDEARNETSLGRATPVHLASGLSAALYVRQVRSTLQKGIIIERNDISTEDLLTAFKTQAVPGTFSNTLCGIANDGSYYIQNYGVFGIGQAAAPSIKYLTYDVLQFLRVLGVWSDSKAAAVLGAGDASNYTLIFTTCDTDGKIPRIGMCVTEGVMIGNQTKGNITPPLAFLHVKNYSGVGNIVAIDEAVAGQTADIHQFKKNGVLLSAIDANGNFTGGITPAAGSITPAMIQDRTRRIFLPNSMFVQCNGTSMVNGITGTYAMRLDSPAVSSDRLPMSSKRWPSV